MGKRKFFVAIPVPPELNVEFFKISSQYTQTFLKWTPEKNLHITLCFIGFIEEDRLDEINQILAHLIFKQFTLVIKEVVPIDRKGRVDMIWVSFEPNAEYNLLSIKLHELLDIPLLRDPLPHITLCRVKQHAKELFPTTKMELKSDLVVQADQVILYESRSAGSGATYFPIKIIQSS